MTQDLHGYVHQLGRHVLISAFQVSDEMSGEILVFVGDQRVRRSLLASTTSPTNPVSVCVDVSCHVIVDDRTDVRNIKTASYAQQYTDAASLSEPHRHTHRHTHTPLLSS